MEDSEIDGGTFKPGHLNDEVVKPAEMDEEKDEFNNKTGNIEFDKQNTFLASPSKRNVPYTNTDNQIDKLHTHLGAPNI